MPSSTTSSLSDPKSDTEELSDTSNTDVKDAAPPGTPIEFRHECSICDTEKAVNDMIQLLPCMHIYCNECITLHKQFGSKVCPQLHCYSSLQPNEEHRLNLCENDLCAHRFGLPSDLFKLTLCKHEIW
uniref:RING-type domain-containing protein n=1 Tax=Panagrolaimus sp. PS1159 TaxID=55785 RepID=A0AC35FY20_9BILA